MIRKLDKSPMKHSLGLAVALQVFLFFFDIISVYKGRGSKLRFY